MQTDSSSASWIAPRLRTSALVTIDVQCDTLDGQPAEVAGTSAALQAIVQLTGLFRAANRPIVHVVRLYAPDGVDVDLCRRAAVQSGAAIFLRDSGGAQLAPGILGRHVELDCDVLLSGGLQAVGADESVMFKPRWGAFYRTPLHEHLQQLGVDTLVFCGCNFPNCPRTSIYEASERDYRIVLATDAISGLYERGVQELQRIGVETATIAEIERGLSSSLGQTAGRAQ
jgi:nicotinamidase-related amidase